MRDKSLTSIFVMALLAFSPATLAWNQFGHMMIAELALQKLDPALQRKLEQQAFALIKQQESAKRLYLMRAYPGTSAFAHLSVFADEHRSEALGNLYQKYANSAPSMLVEHSEADTSNWHYKNVAYQPLLIKRPGQPAAKQCDLSEATDVAWAIKNLQAAFKESEAEGGSEAGWSELDRTLSLALLMHFVGDAHQPLHAISRIDEDCQSDIGGNRFCVTYRANSYSCKTNLHAFWDSALGFFESYESVGDAVDYVSRVDLDERQASNLDVDEWIKESHSRARFVYSIKDGSGGDEFYIKEGQIIAYERIALAAERLSLILEELY